MKLGTNNTGESDLVFAGHDAGGMAMYRSAPKAGFAIPTDPVAALRSLAETRRHVPARENMLLAANLLDGVAL